MQPLIRPQGAATYVHKLVDTGGGDEKTFWPLPPGPREGAKHVGSNVFKKNSKVIE